MGQLTAFKVALTKKQTAFANHVGMFAPDQIKKTLNRARRLLHEQCGAVDHRSFSPGQFKKNNIEWVLSNFLGS